MGPLSHTPGPWSALPLPLAGVGPSAGKDAGVLTGPQHREEARKAQEGLPLPPAPWKDPGDTSLPPALILKSPFRGN